VQSNMDVCFVSSPVTRKVIGLPANVTPLPSPGIRMTAFALIIFLRGLALRHAPKTLQHEPVVPERREFVPKKLQNISDWYALSRWRRSIYSVRSASIRRPKYYFAAPNRPYSANVRLCCFSFFWSGRVHRFPKKHSSRPRGRDLRSRTAI